MQKFEAKRLAWGDLHAGGISAVRTKDGVREVCQGLLMHVCKGMGVNPFTQVLNDRQEEAVPTSASWLVVCALEWSAELCRPAPSQAGGRRCTCGSGSRLAKSATRKIRLFVELRYGLKMWATAVASAGGIAFGVPGAGWLGWQCARLKQSVHVSADACDPKRAVCLTFLSNAFRTERCAPLQSAMALRNTASLLANQEALRRMCSTGSSGVSSNRAVLMSWASVRSAHDARASIVSWYCLLETRICQGTHFMVTPGLNHMCTRESKRMLGTQSESRCSSG